MKKIILILSDEDYDKIEKELVFKGTTQNIKLDITEAWFKESPKFEIEKMKGELL